MGAVAGVRAGVWERRGDAAGPVVLDIDSTLVEVHSEGKERAAAHFKGGYGFHATFWPHHLTRTIMY